MPRTRKISPEESESIEAQRSLEASEKAERRFGKLGTMPLPNGGNIDIGEFIDIVNHDYEIGDFTSIFADTAKWLKNPDPTKTYAWPAMNDPGLSGRIRSRQYRPVTLDELREDSELPAETVMHEGLGRSLVVAYRHVLVEVTPKALKDLYKNPRILSALKVANNPAIEQFRQRTESLSGGLAEANVTVTEGKE